MLVYVYNMRMQSKDLFDHVASEINTQALSFKKETMSFETVDGNEWLLLCDGSEAVLYNMQEGKAKDKKAEYCGRLELSSEDFIQYTNYRSNAMVDFARRLLHSTPFTAADQI
jgi:hypothetical protein